GPTRPRRAGQRPAPRRGPINQGPLHAPAVAAASLGRHGSGALVSVRGGRTVARGLLRLPAGRLYPSGMGLCPLAAWATPPLVRLTLCPRLRPGQESCPDSGGDARGPARVVRERARRFLHGRHRQAATEATAAPGRRAALTRDQLAQRQALAAGPFNLVS